MTTQIERRHVEDWLARYGEAWENGDCELVVSLFSENATYAETPFDTPMVGHDEIRAYWRDGAATTQEEVSFSSTIWLIDQAVAVAAWQAEYVRLPARTAVCLDGVFRLEFEPVVDSVRCVALREWWHRSEA